MFLFLHIYSTLFGFVFCSLFCLVSYQEHGSSGFPYDEPVYQKSSKQKKRNALKTAKFGGLWWSTTLLKLLVFVPFGMFRTPNSEFQAIDSFGNKYLLGVFENKADAEKAFDAWNKEYVQATNRKQKNVAIQTWHKSPSLPDHFQIFSAIRSGASFLCLYFLVRPLCDHGMIQAGKDVKENLKNWAKQQEAELASAPWHLLKVATEVPASLRECQLASFFLSIRFCGLEIFYDFWALFGAWVNE